MTDELFADIFSTIRQRLAGVASRMLKDREDVEDTLQDAFCRMWERRSQMQTESDVVGLGTVTVRNLSIDRLRRTNVRNTIPLNEDIDLNDEGENDDKEELFREVEKIVNNNLSELQRYIFEQKEYEGRKLNDIARELGMQAPAVRMQLMRARKTIGELISVKIKE